MIEAHNDNDIENSMGKVKKQPLLVLIGPTAVGKTELSLKLASDWQAEIISGDSMQVYRGMDIGTAKLKEADRRGIPHHLIDICNVDEPYSVADFQSNARAAIQDIAARGKLPFIVGGTGLYIEALCYNYQFADQGSDETFRTEQEAYAIEFGVEALHRKLAEVDEQAAQRLHPNDQRRIIRALEVHHTTGISFSDQQANQQKVSPYELCVIGLTRDRTELYHRINERVDQMMEEGLLDEVKFLLQQDIPSHAVPMQALGYKELADYLHGYCSYDEAVVKLKRDTRRFAKRQLSWFRHMKEISWINMEGNFNNNSQTIHAIIAGKFQDHLEYTSNQSFVDGGNVQ